MTRRSPPNMPPIAPESGTRTAETPRSLRKLTQSRSNWSPFWRRPAAETLSLFAITGTLPAVDGNGDRTGFDPWIDLEHELLEGFFVGIGQLRFADILVIDSEHDREAVLFQPK